MKERNYLVDIFRYLFALIVVSIHVHPFEDFNVNLGCFIDVILPRLAVPYFFIISGYFLIEKIENGGGQQQVYKQLKNIFVEFIPWSVIYYLIDVYDFKNNAFISSNLVRDYFLQTIYSNGYQFHLWFCVDLIACVLIVYLLIKLNIFKRIYRLLIIPYFLGVLIYTYPEIWNNITSSINILNILTKIAKLEKGSILFNSLPLFIIGYLIKHLKKDGFLGNKKYLLLILLIIILLSNFEVKFVYQISKETIMSNMFSIPLIDSLLILLLLLYKNNNRIEKVSIWCKYASNHTYYSHILFLTIVSKFNLNSLIKYVIVVVECIIFSVFIEYTKDKNINL